MKRKHRELAYKFFSDSEMKCWFWRGIEQEWMEIKEPTFCHDVIYYVGTKAPTEPPKKMCRLGGVEFPMPESEFPSVSEQYFYPSIDRAWDVMGAIWYGGHIDKARLRCGLIHKTEEAAKAQTEAIITAIKKAVKKAKKEESNE